MSKTVANLEKLRDLPDEELRQNLSQTRDDLFRLQLGQYTNQVTSTAELLTKRRDIARILTILRARELGNETQAAKKAEGETPAAEAAPAEAKAKKTKSTKSTKTEKTTTRKAKAKS